MSFKMVHESFIILQQIFPSNGSSLDQCQLLQDISNEIHVSHENFGIRMSHDITNVLL